jgi:hypothetical protein
VGQPQKLTARGEKVLRPIVAERPDAKTPEFIRLLEGKPPEPAVSVDEL